MQIRSDMYQLSNMYQLSGVWRQIQIGVVIEIINILLIVAWVDVQRLVCVCHCVRVFFFFSMHDNSNLSCNNYGFVYWNVC